MSYYGYGYPYASPVPQSPWSAIGQAMQGVGNQASQWIPMVMQMMQMQEQGARNNLNFMLNNAGATDAERQAAAGAYMQSTAKLPPWMRINIPQEQVPGQPATPGTPATPGMAQGQASNAPGGALRESPSFGANLGTPGKPATQATSRYVLPPVPSAQKTVAQMYADNPQIAAQMKAYGVPMDMPMGDLPQAYQQLIGHILEQNAAWGPFLQGQGGTPGTTTTPQQGVTGPQPQGQPQAPGAPGAQPGTPGAQAPTTQPQAVQVQPGTVAAALIQVLGQGALAPDEIARFNIPVGQFTPPAGQTGIQGALAALETYRRDQQSIAASKASIAGEAARNVLTGQEVNKNDQDLAMQHIMGLLANPNEGDAAIGAFKSTLLKQGWSQGTVDFVTTQARQTYATQQEQMQANKLVNYNGFMIPQNQAASLQQTQLDRMMNWRIELDRINEGAAQRDLTRQAMLWNRIDTKVQTGYNYLANKANNADDAVKAAFAKWNEAQQNLDTAMQAVGTKDTYMTGGGAPGLTDTQLAAFQRNADTTKAAYDAAVAIQTNTSARLAAYSDKYKDLLFEPEPQTPPPGEAPMTTTVPLNIGYGQGGMRLPTPPPLAPVTSPAPGVGSRVPDYFIGGPGGASGRATPRTTPGQRRWTPPPGARRGTANGRPVWRLGNKYWDDSGNLLHQ